MDKTTLQGAVDGVLADRLDWSGALWHPPTTVVFIRQNGGTEEIVNPDLLSHVVLWPADRSIEIWHSR